MKKVLKIILVSVLVLSVIGLFAFLYNKSKPVPDIYSTQKPKIDNVIKKTVATGSVVPRQETEIKPQVSGIIEKIYLEAGQKVNSGDVIARVKIIPDMVNLNNAESRLNMSKLNYEDAKIDYERQHALYKKEVIPFEQFQKAQLTFNTAQEEMNSAENNLELIRKGVTKSSVKTTNTLIRATISGLILDVPVKEGYSVIQANTFNPGTTIATVADMGDMIFEGKVDETEVGKIHEGMNIILTIGAIEKETFNATLTYIAPKGKEENGAIQFEIKANVNLKEGQFIRAGYSANASIVLDRRDSVMIIPEGLLKFNNDTAYVEVEVDSQKFERRNVVKGISDGINIEIISGLKLDEKIKAEKIDPKKKPEEGKK